MRYTSDLRDEEWEILEPLLPSRNKTRPMNWEYREIINGILYQLKSGCNWANIPKDLPPYSTLYWHYKQLKKEGVIERISQELHKQARAKAKKK
jgi:transposase